MSIGFLHTADVHVVTFDRLVDEQVGEGAPRRHVVDPSLLAAAIDQGVAAVDDRLEMALRSFPDDVDPIVCTCSTLAGRAEELGATIGRSVIRVDGPMVARALSLGRRIGVAYAVSSTIEPTTELIRREAGDQPIELTLIDCSEAWPAFLAGDRTTYLATIARLVSEAADGLDVVLLCQASMADAAGMIDGDRPVLSSPALAVAAAAASAVVNADQAQKPGCGSVGDADA